MNDAIKEGRELITFAEIDHSKRFRRAGASERTRRYVAGVLPLTYRRGDTQKFM